MFVNIWTTTDCDLNCTYCYEGDKVHDFMTSEIAIKACEFALEERRKCADGSRFILRLHGGEPLLNFDIVKQLCEFTADYFHHDHSQYGIRMTTNALHITPENLPFLLEHIEHISVSIDGKQQSHDICRKFRDGRGSFNLVLPKIRMILHEKPSIWARMTITPSTVAALYENVVFLFKTGFRWISAVPNESDLMWNDDAYEIFKDQAEQCDNYVTSRNQAGENLYLGFLNHEKLLHKNSLCNGGKNNFNIAPNGKLYVCTQAVGIEEFCTGDIFHGINYEKVKHIQELGTQSNPGCIGCASYDYCPATRCKIINYLQTGDYHQPCIGTCYHQNLRIHLKEYCEKYHG